MISSTEESEDDTLYDMSGAREATNLLNGKRSENNGEQELTGCQKFKACCCKDANYPNSVFFIIGNEFCERFSYYGMKTILVIYLTKKLLFHDDDATAIYHAFTMLCYFTPVFGAMLADGYIGKFRTILYVSIIYAIGNIVMALTAIPPAESVGPMIGLLLIGIGTGGIKPCVSAFGGDQFTSDQVHLVATFFSIFYFAINAGSLLSTFFTPILRADIHCLGSEDCYLVAFGVPAVLMIMSLILFVCGKNLYKINPPTGNIVGRVVMCIGRALKNKIRRKNYEIRDHWLDYADDKYERQFIDDARAAIHVLWMFIPLPMFWALFDQQGSRWTLQAEKMDGHVVGSWAIKPDQMQVLNPVLIILLIPVFETFIYPLLNLCKIPNRPLQRMVAGMVLAAVAFVIAGFVQLKIDATLAAPLNSGESDVKFINTLSCPVNVESTVWKGSIENLQSSPSVRIASQKHSLVITSKCNNTSNQSLSTKVDFLSQTGYEVVITQQNSAMVALPLKDHLGKPARGMALLSFVPVLTLTGENSSVLLKEDGGNHKQYTVALSSYSGSEYTLVEPGSYSVTIQDNTGFNKTLAVKLELKNGGVYSLILQLNEKNELTITPFVDVAPNSVPIAYQIPQYFVITSGEVMFSITGLSFAYSQAPSSMKSVLQAGWLLTVAFGDLIVVIIAEAKLLEQAAEFFLFASLMVAVTIVFGIMSCFYKYVDYQDHTTEEDDKALVSDDGNATVEGIPLSANVNGTEPRKYTSESEDNK